MQADRARRWVPLAVVGGLLALAAVAASVGSPGLRRVPIVHESKSPPSFPPSSPPTSGQASLASASPAPEKSETIPSWIGTVVGVVCASLLVALVGVLIWRAARYVIQTRAEQIAAADAERVPEPTRREAVLAAVDAGLVELADEHGDARAAVISCWVRLEEVAATAGTPRGAADTPTELVTRLLAAHQVTGGALSDLAELYRAARYGTGPVGADMRNRALTCLAQLRTELGRSRSGPLASDAVVESAPRHAWPEGGR
ncbi:MAG TPA: DUF4129 domain-containing protein [Micromonosporaceae bacterium]|nr:DUF4129 domain-containing protein [Micromonosporaceae bacterium]